MMGRDFSNNIYAECMDTDNHAVKARWAAELVDGGKWGTCVTASTIF